MSPTTKPTVRRGSKSYTYHIESKSKPGIFHVVNTWKLTCTCPAGKAQQGCWHLRLALGYHDWRQRQNA